MAGTLGGRCGKQPQQTPDTLHNKGRCIPIWLACLGQDGAHWQRREALEKALVHLGPVLAQALILHRNKQHGHSTNSTKTHQKICPRMPKRDTMHKGDSFSQPNNSTQSYDKKNIRYHTPKPPPDFPPSVPIGGDRQGTHRRQQNSMYLQAMVSPMDPSAAARHLKRSNHQRRPP